MRAETGTHLWLVILPPHLVAQTRPLGLSSGDRACLGLGLASKATVYTADKSWKKLRVGARIHVIR